MTDMDLKRRAQHRAELGTLRELAAQGHDVAEAIREEKRRHKAAEALIYRRAHPDRMKAATQRYVASHADEKKKKDLQYRKTHQEGNTRAMRRYRARRKILREFMAIDESIFA